MAVETDVTVEVILRKYGDETMVQWMDDPETCRRFFPAMDNPDFGFRLHDADNAMNKVLCASRRHSAPRDAVDLVSIIERYAPLGPLVWAVSGKDPSKPPPAILQDIRATTFGYSQEQIETVRMEDGSNPKWGHVRETINMALETAATYCDKVAPLAHAGCLFVDENEVPVEADENAVANGNATPIIIRDFSGIPIVLTQGES